VTGQDRTPAGARGFSDVIAAAQAPAGGGPAITTITIAA